MKIRPVDPSDADAIWRMFSAIVADGTTFVHLPEEITTEEVCRYWLEEVKSYVAEEGSKIVGSYYLRPNQVGRGSHVANATYMVDVDARSQGIGEVLGRHSLTTAADLGYKAIQFNAVVSTNQSAVRLWKRLGFEIVGTVPHSFRHPHLGYVDLYIMYQWLDDDYDVASGG